MEEFWKMMSRGRWLTGSLEFSKHYGKYPTLAIVLVRPLYNSFSVHLEPLHWHCVVLGITSTTGQGSSTGYSQYLILRLPWTVYRATRIRREEMSTNKNP